MLMYSQTRREDILVAEVKGEVHVGNRQKPLFSPQHLNVSSLILQSWFFRAISRHLELRRYQLNKKAITSHRCIYGPLLQVVRGIQPVGPNAPPPATPLEPSNEQALKGE